MTRHVTVCQRGKGSSPASLTELLPSLSVAIQRLAWNGHVPGGRNGTGVTGRKPSVRTSSDTLRPPRHPERVVQRCWRQLRMETTRVRTRIVGLAVFASGPRSTPRRGRARSAGVDPGIVPRLHAVAATVLRARRAAAPSTLGRMPVACRSLASRACTARSTSATARNRTFRGGVPEDLGDDLDRGLLREHHAGRRVPRGCAVLRRAGRPLRPRP